MAAMNYGRWVLLFRMPNGCGKRVWELSKPGGNLRILWFALFPK